jgi:hypothetical protein
VGGLLQPLCQVLPETLGIEITGHFWRGPTNPLVHSMTCVTAGKRGVERGDRLQLPQSGHPLQIARERNPTVNRGTWFAEFISSAGEPRKHSAFAGPRSVAIRAMGRTFMAVSAVPIAMGRAESPARVRHASFDFDRTRDARLRSHRSVADDRCDLAETRRRTDRARHAKNRGLLPFTRA